LQKSGKIMVTTQEISEQLNFALPAIYPCKKMRYDHKDYKQLISTVHDQQETISNQQKDHAEMTKSMQKTIADQQATIDRLSLPIVAGSQIISDTITNSSTSTVQNSPISTTNLVTTTTTRNVTQLTGPLCSRCNKNNVTEKSKTSQIWKSRCSSCLSKCRTIEQNRKRRRKD
jgi:hypothetical protein